MPFEHWADAYARILAQVEIDFADRDEMTRYGVYRHRCAEWKKSKGMKLSTTDQEYLIYVEPVSGNTKEPDALHE